MDRRTFVATGFVGLRRAGGAKRFPQPPASRGSFLAAFLAGFAADQPDAAPLRIGTQLQLFVDDYLIDSMRGLELMLHTPGSAGKVFSFDKPWEGNTSGFVTVFKDSDRFRMYYRGHADPEAFKPSALLPGEKPIPKHEQVVCYAESKDGITWTRPVLNLVEFNGSKQNNIIWKAPPFTQATKLRPNEDATPAHNFSPFKDANPDAPPSERYKALGSIRGLIPFKSADGIHWEPMSAEPVVSNGTFDSLNAAFWDTLRKEYVLIYRDKVQLVRTLRYTTSKDFIHWAPDQLVDFGQAPTEHLYTNAASIYFRAPQIYIAIPMRFIPWRRVTDDLPAPAISDAVFMSSRDGLHWDRRFMEAFVRPGRDRRNWVDHGNTQAAAGIVPTGPDEISIYLARHAPFPDVYLERMTLRTDGFVSVHAGYPGGEFTTKPLLLEGNYLVFNYSTSAAGSIQWEIQDENGYPFPGWGFESTKLLVGDNIEEVIQIQSPKHQMGYARVGLEGKPLRLHFVMKDADLYSIQLRE